MNGAITKANSAGSSSRAGKSWNWGSAMAASCATPWTRAPTSAARNCWPKRARARAERGARVYLPDLSDAAAENAGNFDLVVAFDVMEHMTGEQLLVLFDTLAALLKSGGHVLARFPNAQSPLGCVTQNGDWTHRSALSAQVLMQILTGKPWALVRAGDPFMVRDADSLAKRIGLRSRYSARRAIEWMVNRLYGLSITLDPNVVVLLRRD